MYKPMKYILVLVLLLSNVYAEDSKKSLFLLFDNDGSAAFKKEMHYMKRLIRQPALTELGFNQLGVISQAKVRRYDVTNKLPSLKRMRVEQLGLMESLELILAEKQINTGSALLMISSMDYADKRTKTDAQGKTYNDGWITSQNSPLKKLIERYPNKPLNGLKVIILDPSKELKYLKSRQRFFTHLFEAFGADLIYYGSLDGDADRIKEYLKSTKVLTSTSKSPLKNERLLMLDDDVIQYELN